ncbi:MAG: MiaB/RimO family radical SAM methylthiotransferase, partial [Actinomycetota bacterium]|nr:MiaB/RimO family radical SAM methylthiotransferase [Actinomycetota bacterium]
MNEPTYRITTLGCKVNVADSLDAERVLSSMGYVKAPFGEEPDIWLVNTCAVTSESFRKSRKAVGKCLRSKSKVIVFGCAVEFEPDYWITRLGGNAVARRGKLGKALSFCTSDGLPEDDSWGLDGMVRVPVKVQDGCSRYCSYCIVPFLRGNPYSRPLREIINEVSMLVQKGAKEIVLCGVNLGIYKDPESHADIVDLIKNVIDSKGLPNVRLSSIELSDVSDSLVELVKNEDKMAKHLHIPLQSGDERILRLMRREYDPSQFESRLRMIRQEIPDIGVTTDVMIGFPGETDEEFSNTRRFIERNSFSRLHVFRYSPRFGTAAYELGDNVDAKTKQERAYALRALGRELSLRFHSKMVGRIIEVIVESEHKERRGFVFGRASNYVR